MHQQLGRQEAGLDPAVLRALIRLERHLTTDELEAGLDEVRRSPADAGTVELVVARPDVGVRDLLAEGTLDEENGLVGDNWGARNDLPDPDKQLNVINARAIAIPNTRLNTAKPCLHVSAENLLGDGETVKLAFPWTRTRNFWP